MSCDHYVAPSQSIEEQFDYDNDLSENPDEDNVTNSLHQDTLVFEGATV